MITKLSVRAFKGLREFASCPRSAWARGRRDGPDRATRRFAPTQSVGASKGVTP